MSREIPFFELFAQLQLSPELRLKLLGAVIASACIHQDTLSMELAMIVKHPLEPSDLDELNSAIRNGYGLNEVRFRVTLKEEQLPSQRKAAAAPSAPSGGGPSGPVLMGNPIKVKPVEMKTLDLKMGNATVSGKVFSVECVETRRPGMWRLHVEMTDYTSSVAVHKNLTEKEAKGLDSRGEQTFVSEEGRSLLAAWGVPDNYICRAFLALGYCEGPYPQAKPRREGRVKIVEE